MFRSLRARLLLLTATVAGVSLIAAALVSRVAVRTEFQRLQTRASDGGLEATARALSLRLAALSPESAEPSPRVDSLLASLADGLGQELILVGADGRVLGASKPELRSARVRGLANGTVEIGSVVRLGGASSRRQAVLHGLVSPEVHGRDGTVIGRLVPFPRNVDANVRSEAGFLLAVNRWLLLAVLGSGVLALLLTLALSRGIVGPVEVLTGAVRRMEAGDLGQRITIRTRDEIGELARAFNAMATSLERNESLRRALVTDVAHELRTPLTNLRCQIEAIQDGLLPATAATVRSLHDETLLLGRLVDDLQDLALAEAGRLPLDREAVSPADAIAAATAAVGPRAAEQSIVLCTDVPPGLPPVDADPARLGQILRNLLANAVTHTPSGGTITVAAAAGGGQVEITVSDTGPGIGPEHLPHVFERFYRADPSRARASGGAGLGLSIVRQLVAAHGGAVRADSEPGRGARFTVTLPVARPS